MRYVGQRRLRQVSEGEKNARMGSHKAALPSSMQRNSPSKFPPVNCLSPNTRLCLCLRHASLPSFEDQYDDVEDQYDEAAEDFDAEAGIVESGEANGAGGSAGGVANTERITTPYMTKYERARILGTRALQIRYVLATASALVCSYSRVGGGGQRGRALSCGSDRPQLAAIHSHLLT